MKPKVLCRFRDCARRLRLDFAMTVYPEAKGVRMPRVYDWN